MKDNLRTSNIDFEKFYNCYILRINGWVMGKFKSADDAKKALEKYRRIFSERGIEIVDNARRGGDFFD